MTGEVCQGTCIPLLHPSTESSTSTPSQGSCTISCSDSDTSLDTRPRVRFSRIRGFRGHDAVLRSSGGDLGALVSRYIACRYDECKSESCSNDLMFKALTHTLPVSHCTPENLFLLLHTNLFPQSQLPIPQTRHPRPSRRTPDRHRQGPRRTLQKVRADRHGVRDGTWYATFDDRVRGRFFAVGVGFLVRPFPLIYGVSGLRSVQDRREDNRQLVQRGPDVNPDAMAHPLLAHTIVPNFNIHVPPYRDPRRFHALAYV